MKEITQTYAFSKRKSEGTLHQLQMNIYFLLFHANFSEFCYSKMIPNFPLFNCEQTQKNHKENRIVFLLSYITMTLVWLCPTCGPHAAQ